MRSKRALLGILICILATTGDAEASEADGASAQLVGWSEDGRSWAIISSGREETIEVYTENKLVLTLCTAGYPESDCYNSKTQKVIEALDTDKHSAMQRVNVQTHKHLKAFKLKRLSPALRKAFKKSYRLEARPKRKVSGGKKCADGWRLLATTGTQTLHENKKDSGCVRAKGGFLHTSGKYALIKQSHSGEDYDEDVGYSTYDFDSYVFVALPPRAPTTKRRSESLRGKLPRG